jgi:hypothetical protein
MRRQLRRGFRRAWSLRGWWAVAVFGWLYGLPGFVTDGRWWLGAFGGELRGVAFVATAGAVVILGMIAFQNMNRLTRPIARALRR